MSKVKLNFWVGLFILSGVFMVFFLAFKVSNFSSYLSENDVFTVTAIFDNIGDLKVRSPVTVSGVRVGEVGKITLDKKSFRAHVVLKIEQQYEFPRDTAAKILTAGVIGANYIELLPGFDEANLKAGAIISDTQPAIVLENLIGKLIYSMGSKNKEK